MNQLTLFKTMRISTCAKCFSVLLFSLVAIAQANAAEFRVIAKLPLAGSTKWDYLSFEPSSNRLFITHGDRVDVFDTSEKKLVGSIPDTVGVHGVAIASKLNRGYTSNGVSSTVTIFELSSLKVLGTLPTGKKPDAIIFDAHTNRVFVANGDSGTLTVIDALASQLVGTIVIGGKLEFEAVDGKGRLFVNVEDKNVLAVIDTEKLAVTAMLDISSECDSPTGLSIDAAKERLFVGCRNQKMAVVDGLTGSIIASVPVGKGCDATDFDPFLKQAYASSGDGTLTVLNTETYRVEQVVQTQTTARTVALDPLHHVLYLVAAEIEAPAGEGVRPNLKPGTFQLLTVGIPDNEPASARASTLIWQ